MSLAIYRWENLGTDIIQDQRFYGTMSILFFFHVNSCLEKELSWKSHEGNENTYFDLTVSVGYSMKSMSALLCLSY